MPVRFRRALCRRSLSGVRCCGRAKLKQHFDLERPTLPRLWPCSASQRASDRWLPSLRGVPPPTCANMRRGKIISLEIVRTAMGSSHLLVGGGARMLACLLLVQADRQIVLFSSFAANRQINLAWGGFFIAPRSSHRLRSLCWSRLSRKLFRCGLLEYLPASEYPAWNRREVRIPFTVSPVGRAGLATPSKRKTHTDCWGGLECGCQGAIRVRLGCF